MVVDFICTVLGVMPANAVYVELLLSMFGEELGGGRKRDNNIQFYRN